LLAEHLPTPGSASTPMLATDSSSNIRSSSAPKLTTFLASELREIRLPTDQQIEPRTLRHGYTNDVQRSSAHHGDLACYLRPSPDQPHHPGACARTARSGDPARDGRTGQGGRVQ